MGRRGRSATAECAGRALVPRRPPPEPVATERPAGSRRCCATRPWRYCTPVGPECSSLATAVAASRRRSLACRAGGSDRRPAWHFPATPPPFAGLPRWSASEPDSRRLRPAPTRPPARPVPALAAVALEAWRGRSSPAAPPSCTMSPIFTLMAVIVPLC